MLPTYPTEVTNRTTYPIQRSATRQILFNDTMDQSLLWQLQQKVFNSKLDLQKFLLQNDMVAVGQACVEVEIRITQRALPYEATNGKVIDVPEEQHTLTVASWDNRAWLEEM